MTDEPVALNEAPFLSLFLLSFWLGLFGLVSPGLFWSPGLFGVTATLVNSTVTPLPMALPFSTAFTVYLPTFVDTTFSEATPAASVLTVVFPPMAETPSGSSNATSALASGLPNESLTVACTVRMALPSATAEPSTAVSVDFLASGWVGSATVHLASSSAVGIFTGSVLLPL